MASPDEVGDTGEREHWLGKSVAWTLSSLSLGHWTFRKSLHPSEPHLPYQYDKVLESAAACRQHILNKH